MTFQKFKNNSYCVGGKHYFGTKNISGEISVNKKIGKEIKFLVGQCVVCNKRKAMIVSDNTIQAERLSDFFKNLGKKSLMYQKRWQKTYSKNLAELWILQRTLLQQQLPEILKMLCQQYQN